MGIDASLAVQTVRGGTNCAELHCCRTCHEPLAEGRRSPYCTGCRRAYLEERAATPGRRCCDCATLLPAGRVHDRCTDCQRAATAWYDRPRPGRMCTTCRGPLPAQRAHRYCRDCARAQRIARYGTGRFPCTRCGEPIRKWGWQQPRCPDCAELRRFERRLERRLEQRRTTMNRTKTMGYPTAPPQAPNRPAVDRTASPRKGESQAAAGKRARDMARNVARRAGAKPYDAG